MRSTPNGKPVRKLLSRCLATFALLMSMSGCSTKVLIKPSEPYQENQLTLCPVSLPRLSGPTGTDFDASLTAYQNLYTACAVRHNALVGIIRQRKDLEQ